MVAVLVAVAVQAVPAHPQPVKVQQPDGTYVTIKLHGDEWLNFTTTEDGYSVVKDSRGYYVYAELKDQQLQPTAQIAHDAKLRSAAETAFLASVRKYQAPAMKADVAKMKEQVQQQQRRALVSRRATDYNNFRGLVILVQFNDKKFSRDDYSTIIDNMFNKENYSGFDSEVYTGSVHDYFSDNSKGKFKPQFDVVGPYTIDHSQYEGNNNTHDIVNAAVDAADADVDFSQYDGDGDGVVDMVYFVIAGKGSHYAGNDERLWWPHRSNILGDPVEDKPGYYYYKYLDGIRLGDYASSVELDKGSDTKLDGIGVICHEFSHVLGLPDFYDTDYSGSGGQSIHPGDWSLMASGNYLNDSRTPAGYSLYERYLVGFVNDIPLINEKKSYTLEPLHVNQKGYRIDSPVDNEFFLLENRQNDGSYKWDEYLPGHGMLAYRVDRTDLSVWDGNTVNANPAHNYYEILWAGGSEHAVSSYDTFPGEGDVTELKNLTTPANLQTHDGSKTAWGLCDIREDGDNILFNITSGDGPVTPTNVTASNITGTSATVTWTGLGDSYNLRYRVFKSISYDFESAEPWVVDDFAPFTTYDGDELKTYSITGISFTNQQYTGSVIAFQNGISGNFTAHSGNAFGCFMAAMPSGGKTNNDDWFITPEVEITAGTVFSFWARSVNNSYGLERFKVGVYGNTKGTFASYLEGSATTYAEAPVEWTKYSYDLSAYAGQTIRLAINCVSADAFAFCIDDILIDIPNNSWDGTKTNVTTPYVLKGLVPATTYEVQVQAETAGETSAWSSSVAFTTTDASPVLGDASGDGKVDIDDAMYIVNYLMGNAPADFNEADADVTGDGVVTIADAVSVVNIIMNGSGEANVEEDLAIDLGLSVKWAPTNVGASTPEEYGGLYAWGELSEKDGNYTWANYALCNGSETTLTKYCSNSYYGTVDNKTVLDAEDDVARQKYGNNKEWRSPKKSELDELVNQCTWKEEQLNGVWGFRVTGPNGNSIFLPYAGQKIDSGLVNRGGVGFLSTATLDDDTSRYAYCFYDDGGVKMSYTREQGLSVRPVYAGKIK